MTKESGKNLPLFIAVIGIIGTGIGASLSGYFNIQLEKEKLRSSLILKAVETDDAKGALDFLKFLKETKLVDGLDLTIQSWEEHPEIIPLRPVKEKTEPVQLDDGIFHDNKATRLKSLQKMIDEDSENQEQIIQVISTLEPEYYQSLSKESKVNAAFFLNKTNLDVWTSEMRSDCLSHIEGLKALSFGPQAKGELSKLKDRLI